MGNLLEVLRIEIPKKEILYEGKASTFFDILDNSQNLTEEFLYSHQPTSKNTIPVYSTSTVPVGKLDQKPASVFNMVEGPAIVVARKGYAGRLFVVTEDKFIVHEDAYPIKPKQKFKQDINLWWFTGHYSAEFQANRTSEA